MAFVPPILVSTVMLIFPPNLERQKNSRLGRYIRRYMTPTIEAIRLLTLVPMAYGAWIHQPWWIVLGFVVLIAAWCNGPPSSPQSSPLCESSPNRWFWDLTTISVSSSMARIGVWPCCVIDGGPRESAGFP